MVIDRKEEVPKDVTEYQWSEEEIRNLTNMIAMRVMFMGDFMVGKTSLVQTILLGRQSETHSEDRTVVAKLHNWIPDKNEQIVFSLVDLGGHNSYLGSGHYFHCDARNNIATLCHDVLSKDYKKSFTWIKSILTRSPQCNILALLTRSDQIKEEEQQKVKEQFCRKMVGCIRKEITYLEESILMSRKVNSTRITDFIEMKQKYEWLATNLEDITMFVSCRDFETVGTFKQKLISFVNDPDKIISLPMHCKLLYSKIGKVGVSTKKEFPIVSDSKTTDVESKEKESTHISEDENYFCIVDFDNALEIFQTILEETEVPVTDNIKDSLKKCLTFLHLNGLLMYYTGNPELEKVIFNDFKSFINILRCVFHHDIDRLLKYDEIPAALRVEFYGNNRGNFQKDVNKLRVEGVMSLPLLNVLLGLSNCNIEGKIVVALLQKLEVGMSYEIGGQMHLFVPFVMQLDITEEFKGEQHKLHQYKRDHLTVQGHIRGNLPITFWHYLIVRLMKHLHSSIQKKIVWKHGFYASVGKSNCKLLLSYDGENCIDFSVQGCITEVAGHRMIWEYISYINDEANELTTKWWPGLVSMKVVKCGHCLLLPAAASISSELDSEQCIHDIDNILAGNEATETYYCEVHNLESVPAGLTFPLPQIPDEAEKMLFDTKKLIDQVLHQEMANSPSSTGQSESAHDRPEVSKTDLPLDPSSSQNQTISTQMQQICSGLTRLDYGQQKLAIITMLQSNDASCVPIKCCDPVLKQHQTELEEYLDPDEELLGHLISQCLITLDEKNAIIKDITVKGKRKRILFALERSGHPDVKGFIEALEKCSHHGSNNMLAESLKNTLDC